MHAVQTLQVHVRAKQLAPEAEISATVHLPVCKARLRCILYVLVVGRHNVPDGPQARQRLRQHSIQLYRAVHQQAAVPQAQHRHAPTCKSTSIHGEHCSLLRLLCELLHHGVQSSSCWAAQRTHVYCVPYEGPVRRPDVGHHWQQNPSCRIGPFKRCVSGLRKLTVI